MVETIENWKSKNKSFGIVLPSGWFGRPYDNFHHITWIADRKFKLLIEIDEQILLVFTKTKQFEVIHDNKDLLFKIFLRLTFDRLGYGDLTVHTETFDNGEIRFVSYNY
ncbi:MAG: hypothetical protein V4549_16690 [Bacteroidota bacterium]